jgi:hypothetical protein
MADQSERDRLEEGLRLLRAFFRIENREQRLAVINLTEGTARVAPTKPVELFSVDIGRAKIFAFKRNERQASY